MTVKEQIEQFISDYHPPKPSQEFALFVGELNDLLRSVVEECCKQADYYVDKLNGPEPVSSYLESIFAWLKQSK